MAQDLLDIEVRQRIQAHMRPTGEGITRNFNLSIDNAIPLGSDDVDIVHAWTSTSATSGCQCEMLATTGVVSTVAGAPVTTEGDGNDCEGNALAGAVTLVAFYIETAASNVGDVWLQGYANTNLEYTIGRVYIDGGDNTARSYLAVPRTPVVDYLGRTKKMRFRFFAAGDSITVVVLANSS